MSTYLFQTSVRTNIRIYSNIRIFSSEYWYSYSIRCNFQKPNIIRIFEYFARIFPNICLQKSLEIQRFWKFQFHFWHEKIILQQIINCKNSNFFNPLVSSIQVSLAILRVKFFMLFFYFIFQNYSKIFEYSNILHHSNIIRIFLTERIIFDIRFGWFCLDE